MYCVCICVVLCVINVTFIFFFKQKTAYEMRISDWSSDVCSSDLIIMHIRMRAVLLAGAALLAGSAWAQPLSLDQAVERAIAASPEIRAGEAGDDAARAAQIQARVRPNPTISVDLDNAAGPGGYGVFKQSESSEERLVGKRGE